MCAFAYRMSVILEDSFFWSRPNAAGAFFLRYLRFGRRSATGNRCFSLCLIGILFLFQISFNFVSEDAPPQVCAGQKITFFEKVRFGASKRSCEHRRGQKLVIGFCFIENGGLCVDLWPPPVLVF